MNARELKEKYLKFFQSHSHAAIPSAPLIPENDPTTLFISAGMHPLVPYLLGQEHPLGKRLVDVQKCLRTGDIEEVGDTYHHTFFEMLGNWSLGDYFKKEAIQFSYDFLTKELNIDPNYLAVTCFAGDQDAPKDEESAAVWESLGIPKNRIAFLPKKNNWWGPAGATGPCGPDTEMFFWYKNTLPPTDFDPDNEDWLEIWNDVFMQYQKTADAKYLPLEQKNVDTGMGVERTTAVLNGFSDNYLSSIWQPIIKVIEQLSQKSYSDPQYQVSFRVVADHLRSAVFIITDGVEPSNKEAGYVLRRLIRRAIRHAKLLGIDNSFVAKVAQAVIDNRPNYAGDYPELEEKRGYTISVLEAEEQKFNRSLNNGLREIDKLISKNHDLTGQQAFDLYQSFGFPVEMIQEELSKHQLSLDLASFEKAKLQHSEKSKTLSAGKFKSGLADNSQTITRYHTATHLLHAALRKVLGEHVQQSGSNITSERLRFDFTHPQKLSPEEIKKIEELVNQQIEQALPVSSQEMKFTEAQKLGALAFFGAKYPEIVSVYTVGDPKSPFSREVCTGPHVKNTKEIKKLTITKEESASAGKRRLYAQIPE